MTEDRTVTRRSRGAHRSATFHLLPFTCCLPSTINPHLAPDRRTRLAPAPPATGKMPYFFHIVKEQPITPGQKPEANRAPRRRSLLDSLPATRASGGAGRDRTDDPLLAKQVLSQLSYSPLGARPLTVAANTGGSGWIRTIDPRLIKTVL